DGQLRAARGTGNATLDVQGRLWRGAGLCGLERVGRVAGRRRRGLRRPDRARARAPAWALGLLRFLPGLLAVVESRLHRHVGPEVYGPLPAALQLLLGLEPRLHRQRRSRRRFHAVAPRPQGDLADGDADAARGAALASEGAADPARPDRRWPLPRPLG